MHHQTAVMKIITLFFTCISLSSAALNTTRMYYLKTQLKPDSDHGKAEYGDLWLSSYHTGAGTSDVTFLHDHNASTDHMKGYLGAINVTANDMQYYNALFDFGSDYPWGLVMVPAVSFYSAWQPVRVNIGVSGPDFTISGFFMNDTGLQWTSNVQAPGSPNDMFGGWLVCDWWHGDPQLFFRISYYSTPAPGSCADVYLKPVYI
ncbi:uncharacterized protein RCC_03993 [Ramularia collo-cygni]|uniref:DUF7907 domain-containing protein n=1 Tax=Ramularia collo-cygni TaxID=112498 RepID=A0A2D3VCC0_9PEZI|nr:uncharacterized protein RCC_03993 [Ramularia collo-cygni]CZT18153.1 uncharacterized protein RCC_03993 [Ramularia collo-cygni]